MSQHATDGLTRPCNANDVILVTEGLQCGNCLALLTPQKPQPPRCVEFASDGPCPLAQEQGDTLCWVHRTQADFNNRAAGL